MSGLIRTRAMSSQLASTAVSEEDIALNIAETSLEDRDPAGAIYSSDSGSRGKKDPSVHALNQTGNSAAQHSSPLPGTPVKRSLLKRNFSSQSLLKSALSGTNLFRLGSRSRDESPTRSSRPKRNTSSSRGKSPPRTGINSPGLQAMLGRDTIPDLESVNRALEELSSSPDDSERNLPFTQRLEKLALELNNASQDYRKLLQEAMAERDRCNVERCRAKCILIIHGKHADVETKIYAYNILSTQASFGQAERFLNESEKLIRYHAEDRPELERLTGVIHYLRECAREKGADDKSSFHSKTKEKHGFEDAEE